MAVCRTGYYDIAPSNPFTPQVFSSANWQTGAGGSGLLTISSFDDNPNYDSKYIYYIYTP